ncbi:MAG: hypothetical protein EOP86_01760 [Verrucomicrobiaceae bacterium]|nr:MAG: hypothetical protein EOP86_01760 [Verrucomicrobiaceae bacterium]
MRIYHSLKDIPELAALPPKERRRVHNACLLENYSFLSRHGLMWLTFVCFCAGVGAALGFMLHRIVDSVSLRTCERVGAAVGYVFGGFVYGQMIHRKLRPHYAEFIRKEPKAAASGPDL